MAVVLVVEGDFLVQTFLEFVLDEAGFDVQVAASGPHAIELLGRDPNGFRLLVVAEEHLPSLPALREINPAVPSSVLTNDRHDVAFRPWGAIAVFAKPITDSAKFIYELRQLAGMKPQPTFMWPTTEPFPAALRSRRPMAVVNRR